MRRNSHPIFHLVVLVPHHELRSRLEKIRGELGRRGVLTARTFPPIVPLAPIAQPLRRDELQVLATRLRERTKGEDGFLSIGMPVKAQFDLGGGKSPWLVCPVVPDLGVPPAQSLDDCPTPRIDAETAALRCQGEFEAGTSSAPALVLSRLDDELADSVAADAVLAATTEDGFPLRARTAYVANFAWAMGERGDGYDSVLWEIGEPCWLPSWRAAGTRGR